MTTWQEVVSALRRHLRPYLDGDALSRAENLWQQARVLVGEMAWRELANQALRAELQAIRLRDIGSALITTFDVEGLIDVLVKGLPRLGIPSAYLSLYEDPQPRATRPQLAPEWSRLMLAYDAADASQPGRVELKGDARRFRTR